MTSRTIALATGAIALLWSAHAFAQCTKDTDCRGDRICQQGTCVAAETPPPSPPPPPPSQPPPASGGPVELGARRLALKAHPLTTLGGLLVSATNGITVLALPLEVEYALIPNFSIFGQLTPLFVSTGLGSGPGLIVGGGARFYPFAQALQGLWFGGLLAGGSTGFDVQVQGGWAWVFDNGFYLSVGGSLSLGALLAGVIPIGIVAPIGIAF